MTYLFTESKVGSFDIIAIFQVGDRTFVGKGRSLLPGVKLNLAVVLSKKKIAVIPLQEQIVDKLKNFSEIKLQKILNFADFLLLQPRKQEVGSAADETGNSKPANIDEESEVHYIGGVLVVKASLIKNQERINWDTIIPDMREDAKYLIQKT
ncbi:hypothetical protein QUB70_14695 [Microcoleus sp. A003_D6]|uniref:hypothetical protein n=1 Tax=Microcoleus sp. A003_D6 TaxID=3055266 RepID=UPI002FD69E45